MAEASDEKLLINTIRFLAVDAVDKANSGHPGAPMGMAPLAYVLWDNFLSHNPADPAWPNRDRFILSAGHASALIYAMLHLTGYDLSLEEIKQFRQWGSRTPGHPEHGLTPGVETTSGPLGQGFTNGVGMALAERWLAARFNQPGHEIISHYTYALVSDGEMMEGVSSEAASLAGTLGLGKLIYLYDANKISIEGSTDAAFTEDVATRFKGYHWQVIGPVDGLDTPAITNAIGEARANTTQPSLIICRTTIGYGSPNKAGKASVHGEPLGAEETLRTKQALGWAYSEPFTVPEEAYRHLQKAKERGGIQQEAWAEQLEAYQRDYPTEYKQLIQVLSGALPEGWDSPLGGLFTDTAKGMATREASGIVINSLAKTIPNLIGGSADLAPSNKTDIKNSAFIAPDNFTGNNIHFGVREHAMGAIANGLALHGGVIPYSATFLVFYDYMRPPVRLAALMGLRTIFIFTHDSIGVGEDGPTHQPIEHLSGLRSVPNLVTLRPADATETAEAWRIAISRQDGPTTMVLTRQKLNILDRKQYPSAEGTQKGAYTLWESDAKPQIIIMGTGSEVHIALEAGQKLAESGVKTRVVSMPSWELFEAQNAAYRESVLPKAVARRIAVEAGSPLGWHKYTGDCGKIIGINHFGASAPANILYEKYGLTAENVAAEAKKLLSKG
ncbi:transketolase [Chloroflexota bacterium]